MTSSPTAFCTHVPSLPSTARHFTPHCCATSLSPEARRAVQTAVRATHALQTPGAQVSSSDLLTFCSVKGVSLPLNIWDHHALEQKARMYLSEERAARIKAGDLWDSLSNPQRLNLLHRICNGEADVTYIDPASGYTVFSAFGHLKRGHCCGVSNDGRNHRCRHCPYATDGRLVEKKMVALRDRIAIVEAVKEGVQNIWHVQLHQTSQVEQQTSAVETLPVTQTPSVPKRVKLPSVPSGDHQCQACGDKQTVKCTRCNGWTVLVSPKFMACPQCSQTGYHPCMACTSFRPPTRSSFYS